MTDAERRVPLTIARLLRVGILSALAVTMSACNAEIKERRDRCAALGGVLVLSTEPVSARRDVCVRRDAVLGEF